MTSTGDDETSISRQSIRSKKFTLDRRRAREIEDLALANSLSQWLTAQTSITCTSDNLSGLVEEGVITCILARNFGQATRFWNPPNNEFQRRENIALFARACSRLGLSCEPIPNRKNLDLRDIVPCLMELAALAKRHEKSMRMIVSSIPTDLAERISSSTIPEHDPPESNLTRSDEITLFSLKLDEKSKLEILLTKDSIEEVTWKGACVLLKDILHFQKSRFAKPDHQLLCLGLGVTLCGIWGALNGSDVVLTDFPKNIDKIWADVASNSVQIQKSGGSCGARSLEFKDMKMDMAMTVAEMDLRGDLTVLSSDAYFTAKDLTSLVAAVFDVRKDAVFYIVVHHDHAFQDFFKELNKQVTFLQVFGDLEYRIIRGEATGSR